MERRLLRHDRLRADRPAALGSVDALSRSGSGLALVTDDRDWIERIRGGNPRALELLFRTHLRPLTAFAYRYVQSREASIAVVQEVFARLWRGRHSWAFHGSVRGNLFASAHRAALESLHRMRNEARWHAGLPMPERTDAASSGSGSDAGARTRRDWEAAVGAAIARLPARARTAGYMRWGDRLTRAEVATVLGLNVRTVHTQITPASRAMRKRLAPLTESLDLRPAHSTLRDAGENADAFPTIDPDRLEYYLAGECLPAEEAALRREIVMAGGDAIALDIICSVWTATRRDVEEWVDEDRAWRALARRMSLPHAVADPAVAGRSTRGIPLPPLREVGASLARWARGGRDAAARGARSGADHAREWTTVLAPRIARAVVGARATVGPAGASVGRATRAMASRVALRLGPALEGRTRARVGALALAGLVAVGGVWAFAAHRAVHRAVRAVVRVPVPAPRGAIMTRARQPTRAVAPSPSKHRRRRRGHAVPAPAHPGR